MSTFEYITGLVLGVVVAILLAMILRTGKNVLLRTGVGLLIGFSALLIGLMIASSFGNLYLNTVITSVILSLIARNAWG